MEFAQKTTQLKEFPYDNTSLCPHTNILVQLLFQYMRKTFKCNKCRKMTIFEMKDMDEFKSVCPEKQ